MTIKDVAEHAGVSLGTASNVLNRPVRVAPETLARVLAVIDRLGFVRSSAAHQMRGRSNSRCFGAVVLDASNPFSTETVHGLEDTVHEQGSAVVLCSTDGSPDREARYLRWLEEQRVQGIVITPATRIDPPSRDIAGPGHPRRASRPAQQSRRTVLGLG